MEEVNFDMNCYNAIKTIYSPYTDVSSKEEVSCEVAIDNKLLFLGNYFRNKRELKNYLKNESFETSVQLYENGNITLHFLPSDWELSPKEVLLVGKGVEPLRNQLNRIKKVYY